MQEETIKKFKEFNFAADQKWQEHLQMLFPIPPIERIRKVQKKWYQKNIDPSFDPEVDLDAADAQRESQRQQNHSTHYQSQSAPAQIRPFSTNKLYHIEGLLKIVFILLAFVGQFSDFLGLYTLVVGFVICLMGVYRQIGRPQFNKEYAADIMANEFALTLFFILSIITVTHRGPFIYLPLILQFIIGVAEFEARSDYPFLKFQKLKDFFNTVQAMKTEIKTARAYIEFFNIFYFILLISLGKVSLILIIIYVNYIKFKFKLSQSTHYAVNATKSFLLEKTQSLPGVGAVLNKVINGVFWVVTA